MQIALYQGIPTDLTRVTFVQTISLFTENTGIFNWTVPVSACARLVYAQDMLLEYSFQAAVGSVYCMADCPRAPHYTCLFG